MNHPAAVAAYDSCYTGVTLNHKSIYQSTVFQPNLLGQAMPALFESPSKQNNSELYINWNCGMLNPHKCPPPDHAREASLRILTKNEMFDDINLTKILLTFFFNDFLESRIVRC